ncbi:MAG: hypothetical protein JW892_16950 [Anaerolineae bacterium]|nr:hypothetical protein [Anaerolineae bacterium]
MTSHQPHSAPGVILLSGTRQVGKSTLCQKLVARWLESGVGVAGLLTTHTGFHDLEVREIHTGVQYPLTLPYEAGPEGELGRFRMDDAALARGLISLKQVLPTSVLIVDELGPLELKLGKGWLPVLEWLRTDCCRIAVLVIRPELLTAALARLPEPVTTVVYVTPENRDGLLETLLHFVEGGAQALWA